MTEIKKVLNYEDKVKAIEKVVTDLPDWFGEGVRISDMEKMSGSFENALVFAAYENNEIVGFMSIKRPTQHSAEIGALGVLSRTRGKGVGKILVSYCEDYCRKENIEFLTVKTIDESSGIECYGGTRAFYKALNFKPIDILPTLWGEQLPCIYFIKPILQ